MPLEEAEATNNLYKFLYNNRTFIKALPIGRYVSDLNGVEFPSARKGDSFCYLHFSDAIIAALNTLKSKYEINFEPHSAHITIFANKDFEAPIMNKPSQCHFTIKYSMNQQPRELRVYYATDGEMLLKDCNDPDKAKSDTIASDIFNLELIKSLDQDFSALLAKLYNEHAA
jgi:hypothetical protein